MLLSLASFCWFEASRRAFSNCFGSSTTMVSANVLGLGSLEQVIRSSKTHTQAIYQILYFLLLYFWPRTAAIHKSIRMGTRPAYRRLLINSPGAPIGFEKSTNVNKFIHRQISNLSNPSRLNCAPPCFGNKCVPRLV